MALLLLTNAHTPSESADSTPMQFNGYADTDGGLVSAQGICRWTGTARAQQ